MLVGLFTGCDYQKLESTKRSMDSLSVILESNREMNKTLVDIGVLMDSIDASRSILRVSMVEGLHYDTYVGRLREINQYVRSTEAKLVDLERRVRRSNDIAYELAIKRLKANLEVRTNELAALEEQVKQYRSENESLNSTVNQQRAELREKHNQLQYKREETAHLEQEVSTLIRQAKLDQGDALFAQAAAVEETARRTKFAPRKRKMTERHALELYREALLCGNAEAQTRIAALEK